jgi:hypothetical protein
MSHNVFDPFNGLGKMPMRCNGRGKATSQKNSSQGHELVDIGRTDMMNLSYVMGTTIINLSYVNFARISVLLRLIEHIFVTIKLFICCPI